MMRKLSITVAVCLLAVPLLAQNHQSRFELTDEFVRSWSAEPVRDVEARLDCAGPVHTAEKDCEIHIGAEFVDPSFTDFPNVVLEPPNLCQPPRKPTRAELNELSGEECTANGFLRAWPEHLDNGSGCSNPDHFLEVHPMVRMKCPSQSFDFIDKLHAEEDLGFKSPEIVEKMMDMQYWVCRGCSADEKMLSFDYCFGDPCRAGHASNFARMSAEIIRSTIRPVEGRTLDDVATVIARVQPDPDSPRRRPMKLYAVKGTKFYDDLLAERGKTGPATTFEVLGIFALDPFSIVRTIEGKKFSDGEWTPVGDPVSLVVFGSL
jgi:hypothetical protein